MQLDGLAREQVSRYLAGAISLEDLEVWLAREAWGREDIGPVAAEADLRLAEYSGGHWSEDELRAALRDALGPFDHVVAFRNLANNGEDTHIVVGTTPATVERVALQRSSDQLSLGVATEARQLPRTIIESSPVTFERIGPQTAAMSWKDAGRLSVGGLTSGVGRPA